jgi:hypothetical protein
LLIEAREAAEAALAAGRPADCPESQWQLARRGFERFVAEGRGDRAAKLGWTADELYRPAIPVEPD